MQRVQRDLAWVYAKMQHLTVLLLERGMQLAELERSGELLVRSSDQFVVQVVPWHKRCWHQCGCRRKCRRRTTIIDVSADADAVRGSRKRLADNGLVEL